MGILNSVKRPLAALALVSAPFFAAQANTPYYLAKCSFEGMDPSQNGECHATVKRCITNGAPMEAEATPVDPTGVCRSVMRVVCDKRTVFYGAYTVTTPDSVLVATGIPNGSYPYAARITSEYPNTLPDTVDARLEWRGRVLDGGCLIKAIGLVPADGADLN